MEYINEVKRALKSLPDKPLKGVNLASAIAGIDEAPERQYWEDLKFIPKLKCGITRGGKLKALETVFYVKPELIPEAIARPRISGVVYRDRPEGDGQETESVGVLQIEKERPD